MEFREFLEKVGDKFLERAKERPLSISRTQVGEIREDKENIYRKLYLPPDLSKIVKGYIHFEWLIPKRKVKKTLVQVALHLEYPKNRNYINQNLLEFLRQRVDFKKLAQDAKGRFKIIKRNLKWITILREYDELNEDAIEWTVDTMVLLYETLLPHLEEFLENEMMPVVDKMTHKNFSKNAKLLDELLERKGQIILYGPPGTGKTWIAMEYVKLKVPGGSYQFGRDSTLRDDIKYYILVMSTAKYDPTLIREGLEETFSGKLQRAFEDVEEGDIAFVYLGIPEKRVIGIAKCTGKINDGARFKIIKLVDGPTYDEMKTEEPIRRSSAIKTNLRGTLFPISSEEAFWVASKIGFDDLGPLGILSESRAKTFSAFDFVTFHPAFSYEDFVEGIKPETYEDPETGKKELLFKVEEGIFKRMARNAYNALLAWAGIRKEWTENSGVPVLNEDEKRLITTKLKTDPDNVPKFYLVIDEINRGDIPKIFGELITLLETDKRLFMEHETATTLPYSKKRFGVPPNLYIIGTMNTSDRSIALIDVALRRRFGFIEVMPDYDIIKKHIIDKASEGVKPLAEHALKALETLNKRIRREYDRDHQIGHSYYLRLQGHLKNKEEFIEELKMIWFYEILPLLHEYFYDSPEKLKKVLKSKDPEVSFLEIDDSEGIVEFRSEDEFDNEIFLQALKSLIEAEKSRE